MQLNERQQQQVEAIGSLVTQTDRSAIRQGIELAAALGDQDIFAGLLDGLSPSRVGTSRFAHHRRYPTPGRALRFDTKTGNQTWLDLSMLHLLAASDLPTRSKVASVALGTPVRKFSTPTPALWIDGLEKLDALTHLDLHLSKVDRDLDLSALAQFPSLTHVRIRGGVLPGPIPSMNHLQELNGVRIAFEPGTTFPALQSIRGQIFSTEPLSPERMPNLVDIETRESISIVGFESLDRFSCTRGEVELLGCRRVEHLGVSTESFHAPDLAHVGLLDRARGIEVSQLETLREVKLNRTTNFRRAQFPKGTQLADPKVVLFGPGLTDLGNIGELPGLEVLLMPRVSAPISLETLRHATDLRVLDIRKSPGITDLSPLTKLPKLETLVLEDADRYEMPAALAALVEKSYRPHRLTGPLSEHVKKQA